MRWTVEEWQAAADVAQFYLTAGANGVASMLDGMVDVGRCEQVLADAAEFDIKPKGRDELLAKLLKSDRFPTFPGETEPPLL